MPVQPIDPVSDPRVEHKFAKLNGYNYHYLYAVPQSGEYTHTVFLVGRVWCAIIYGRHILEALAADG
jgi:hypothetical protein